MATSHHLHHAAGFPSYHTAMMSAAGGANSSSSGGGAAAAGGANMYRNSSPYQQQQQQQHQPADFFTAEMRDRQARGKDPYRDSDSDSDNTSSADYAARGRTTSARADTFAYAEQRRQATQILDTPELLMVNAQRDGMSIPATRLRYTRMLCGVEENTVAAASSSNRQSGGSGKNSSRHGGSGRKSAGNTPKKRDRASRTQ